MLQGGVLAKEFCGFHKSLCDCVSEGLVSGRVDVDILAISLRDEISLYDELHSCQRRSQIHNIGCLP